MSSRPHMGQGGMRGYRHQGEGGQWGNNRGGMRNSRPDYHHQQQGHSSRGGMHSARPRQTLRTTDPEKLLASLGPDGQLALTTAIINTVFKSTSQQETESRRNFREDREQNYPVRQDREQNYPVRDNWHNGQGGRIVVEEGDEEPQEGYYYRDEIRQRRPYGETRRYDNRWNEEGRGRHYDQEKGISNAPRHHYDDRFPPAVAKRRPSPHMHQEPTYKRPRIERFAPSVHDRVSHRQNDYRGMEGTGRGRPRMRDHQAPNLQEEGGWQRREEKEGKAGTSGVQVTIGADGERAVNDDGQGGTVAGRLFVELKCPHCPVQKSITFKEYKMHLKSDYHSNRLNKLARKHIAILRNMRGQQRDEQKRIEDEWKEENPGEFQTAVTRYCRSCNLAFKCIPSNLTEEMNQHNRSKMHRMQRHYLRPRCGVCHMNFQPRMRYEAHLASITHLRALQIQANSANSDSHGNYKTADDQGEKQQREGDEEEAGDDLDFANFMTVDAVGDDDEEKGGSEHDEITGGKGAAEAWDKEGDNDLDDISDESITGDKPAQSQSKDKPKDKNYHEVGKNEGHSLNAEEEEEEELSDWEKEIQNNYLKGEEEEEAAAEKEEEEEAEAEAEEELEEEEEEEEEEEYKPLGTEYVRRIEAYFCSICFKIIRADSSLGSRVVQRHCRSFPHLSHYRDLHPIAQEEDGEKEVIGEDELVEEPDQDKLWEEFDKGLTALQGELMTDMDMDTTKEEIKVEPNKKALVNKENKKENSSNEGQKVESKNEGNKGKNPNEEKVEIKNEGAKVENSNEMQMVESKNDSTRKNSNTVQNVESKNESSKGKNFNTVQKVESKNDCAKVKNSNEMQKLESKNEDAKVKNSNEGQKVESKNESSKGKNSNTVPKVESKNEGAKGKSPNEEEVESKNESFKGKNVKEGKKVERKNEGVRKNSNTVQKVEKKNEGARKNSITVHKVESKNESSKGKNSNTVQKVESKNEKPKGKIVNEGKKVERKNEGAKKVEETKKEKLGDEKKGASQEEEEVSVEEWEEVGEDFDV